MQNNCSYSYDLAISFAGEDRDVAMAIVDELKAREVSVFYDDDHRAELWGENLYDRLARLYEHDARFALILASRHYVKKRWTKLERQAIQARAFKHDDAYLLPLRLDFTELEGLLATVGYIEWKDNPQEIAELIRQKLAKPKPAPPPNRPSTSKPMVATTGLPVTSAALFGRNRELAQLDEYWQNAQTHIVVITARGGEGKTALANRWLSQMAADEFRGARRVYAWSFYSQGAGEDKQASADRFIDQALRWFGDPDPEQGDVIQKAARLAGRIQQSQTLLILDGLEPLQYPPGPQQGRLKDRGMQTLLRNLALQNPGLCVITTRLWVDDLNPSLGSTTAQMPLNRMAPEDGAELLQHLGVQGNLSELENACRDFDGHALALTLLGTYLSNVCGGDVRQKDAIACLMIEEDSHGRHARRMMASYEHWLATTETGRRELNILRLMGLFDRPAEPGAIRALLDEPVINGLTDDLLNSESSSPNGFFRKVFGARPKKPNQADFQRKWRYAIQSLRQLRLLLEPASQHDETLDCHPLIREHFGEQLRASNPSAWRDAHERLYEYYKALPEKKLPDTLAEMEPLFAAVTHGCLAGKHQAALDDVYFSRIQRDGRTNYCCNMLGAFGADLAAVANFFETLWTTPAQGLNDNFKAGVLNWAGFRLRALGRLREAAQPMRAGMEAFIKQENWKAAAVNAGNLSELWLAIGDLSQAVEYARKSVEWADQSGDDFQKYSRRTTLADALHQAGDVPEALQWFEAAEALQAERQPEYPYLYSTRGFKYCDLLLSQGKARAVAARSNETIKIAQRNNWLLDIALDHLTLGKAALLHTQAPDLAQAETELNRAVQGLVKYGSQQHLPRGLLARAALFRRKGEFAKAWADLDEALEIADRSGMRLYLTDYHLEACRLCRDQNLLAKAREHLETARMLVDETGYHRRDGEVAELAAPLKP